MSTDEPMPDVASMSVEQLRRLVIFLHCYREGIENALNDVLALDDVRRARRARSAPTDGAAGAIRLIAQQRDDARLQLLVTRGDGVGLVRELTRSVVLEDPEGVDRPVCQRARFFFHEEGAMVVITCGKCDICAADGPGGERIRATLHTSASDLPPAAPNPRRVERVRQLTRSDPVWREG